VTLRDLGFYVRGRINSGITRVLNTRRGGSPLPPAPLAEVIAGEDAPLALTALLEGRSNAEREAAVGWYLAQRGVTVERQRFATFEGSGENLSVDVGSGDRVLVLIAHHDAVPGSPGANDNAAAVGILLHLLPRLSVPRTLRVRLLFTAAEELGYLGARAYVREMPLGRIAGVLSLELCGIGDSVAVWDATSETDLLRRVTGALGGMGLQRDAGYHVVGRIPVFGSDHRAFAAAGIPAYGLSVVPFAEADALRRFVLSPVRSALLHAARRPPPFDTYHTSRDASSTLDPRALDLIARSLSAIVEELGSSSARRLP
jgi:Zn-dependent M28 family amino/carboxypeptidase